jgi:endonuclease I
MEFERFDALQEISMEQFKDTVEERFPYNCEHVVPQSWFNKMQPMRGDLHHLFACEVRCNSYRSNHRYHEFEGFGTDSNVLLDMENCGRAKAVNNIVGFEPEINKGTVARATLYFLVRYPGGMNEKGYNASHIPMLLSWHKQHPVSEYEKHRNQYIYNIQRNRNPFIDYSDIADRIDFRSAFQNDTFLDWSNTAAPDDEPAAEETLAMGINALGGCVLNSNPKPWRVWRTAEALRSLLRGVNQQAPQRRKQSDGTIGDIAHQGRKSDHNPQIWDDITKKGVVTALDITHDPMRNCNCEVLAKSLQANKDARIKYIIWNKQIMNSFMFNGIEAWTWRPYMGANPHDKHIHVSVKCEKELYDDGKDWTFQCN